VRLFRKAGKWMVIFYIAQSVISIGLGLYIGIEHPEKIERIVSCVTD